LVFGVNFTSELAHNITGVPLHVRLHPTQLYEAALVLLMIPFLMWLRKTRSFYGPVMLAYVVFYAVARFFLEFLRGDPRGYFFKHLLSTSQVIGVLIIPVAIFLLFHLSGQRGDVQGSDRKTIRSVPVGKVGVRT
jgi:phosphatidylglycerol:prolipoprotein diacylglycerol transferase